MPTQLVMNSKFPLHSYLKYKHAQIKKKYINIFISSTSLNRFTVDASATSICNSPHMKQNTKSNKWLINLICGSSIFFTKLAVVTHLGLSTTLQWTDNTQCNEIQVRITTQVAQIYLHSHSNDNFITAEVIPEVMST